MPHSCCTSSDSAGLDISGTASSIRNGCNQFDGTFSYYVLKVTTSWVGAVGTQSVKVQVKQWNISESPTEVFRTDNWVFGAPLTDSQRVMAVARNADALQITYIGQGGTGTIHISNTLEGFCEDQGSSDLSAVLAAVRKTYQNAP